MKLNHDNQLLNAESSSSSEAQRLRILLSSTSDIIALIDEAGTIQYVNEAVTSLLGYQPEELTGENAFEMVHAEDREAMRQAVSEVWNEAREPHLQTFRFCHRDDSWRVLEAIGRPYRENGTVRGLVISARDVTERQTIQGEMQRREAHLEALALAQNEIATAQLDVQHVMQQVVERVTQLTGAESVAILTVEKDKLIFKAATGLAVPYIGQQVDLKNSLSGQAVLENRLQRCDDTDEHPLLERDKYRRFGVRSVLAVPLRYGEKISWVLALGAARPHAFTEEVEQTITLLSGLCAAVLSRAVEFEARQNTSAALAESEQRFKNAFEQSALGMAIVSPDGRWLQVNRKLHDILGYTSKEFLKRTFQEITYPADLEADLQLVERLVKGEISSYSIEKRYFHKDGHIVWALLSVTLVRDEKNQPLHFISQIQDITERKRAEDALRQSEARKAAIIETSLDAIVKINHEGRIIDWNPAAETTFGYSRAQAMGQLMHKLIVPPELRDDHIKGLQKYLETGEGPVLGHRIELPAMRADGTRILVEAALVAIRGFGPPLFTGHLRDITQRKASEDALTLSEARYTRIASNVPGMVYQFRMAADGVMSFPFVSEGSRDVIGLEPQEIMDDAQALLSLAHPDDRASFQLSIAESAMSVSPWQWEGRAILRNGEERWLKGISRPNREENGDIVWDGLLLDITKSKQAEAEIQLAHREAEIARTEAERANLAKSEFLSRMSHELRTPLNAILGFGQLLEISHLSEDDALSVKQILKGGRHLLELINEVLDIAKIEAGRLTLSPEPVLVWELCDEALNLIRPLATQKRVYLYDHSRDCPRYVHCDRQRFKQIMLNLLSNAVKYNREGGTITISCGPTRQGYVRIRVTDTGYGISAEQREKLFTPFERLGADKYGIEGTGIGLALSRRLASAMNGLLDVESVPGQGSTFYLELPATENPLDSLHADGASSKSQSAQGDGRSKILPVPLEDKRTILYIEDNLSNLQLLQRIMQRRPHLELLSAMQGRLGIELAKTHKPDLILLDLHLPEMEGIEVLRHLRTIESTRHIPVIIISADATPGQIERLMEAGALHYLTKPLDVRQFLDVLDNSLSKVK